MLFLCWLIYVCLLNEIMKSNSNLRWIKFMNACWIIIYFIVNIMQWLFYYILYRFKFVNIPAWRKKRCHVKCKLMKRLNFKSFKKTCYVLKNDRVRMNVICNFVENSADSNDNIWKSENVNELDKATSDNV